jgi:hypothetical protein
VPPSGKARRCNRELEKHKALSEDRTSLFLKIVLEDAAFCFFNVHLQNTAQLLQKYRGINETDFVGVSVLLLLFDFLLDVLHKCVFGVSDDHLKAMSHAAVCKRNRRTENNSLSWRH